jgi:hypothetical protein
MRRARFLVCAGWLAGLGLVLATGPAPAQEIESACVKDVERLCPDLEPGPKLRKCIREKREEFSPECKARAEEREKVRREFLESCTDDIRTYCANTERGRGRLRRCLEAQLGRLTPECRSAVEQTQEAPEAPGAPEAP